MIPEAIEGRGDIRRRAVEGISAALGFTIALTTTASAQESPTPGYDHTFSNGVRIMVDCNEEDSQLADVVMQRPAGEESLFEPDVFAQSGRSYKAVPTGTDEAFTLVGTDNGDRTAMDRRGYSSLIATSKGRFTIVASCKRGQRPTFEINLLD